MQDELSEGKSILEMTDEQVELWEYALETLLETLTLAHDKTEKIRTKLEQISKDMVELKTTIQSTIATASTNVDAQTKKLTAEYEEAKGVADKNQGCFQSFSEGIKTILSLGITCYQLVQTYKKAESSMKEVKKAQADFENNVVPLVSKMEGLNGVADDLL